MTRFEKRMSRRLERELENVRRWMRLLSRGLTGESVADVADNTPLTEEADAAQMAEDNEARLDLLGRLHDRAAALERALVRLKQGVYPLSAECGKPIHPQRLEALPETDGCLRCQERLEETRRLESGRAGRLRSASSSRPGDAARVTFDPPERASGSFSRGSAVTEMVRCYHADAFCM